MQAPEDGEELADSFRQVDRQIDHLKVLQSWQVEAILQVKTTSLRGIRGFFEFFEILGFFRGFYSLGECTRRF